MIPQTRRPLRSAFSARSTMKPATRLCAVIAALTPFGYIANAQTTITWANAGTVANTASNWVGTPTLANSVSTGNIWTFSNVGAGNNSVSFTSNRSVVGVVFDVNANAYSIGAGGFTLSIGANGITNNSTTAQVITSAISVGNSQSWTTVAGGNLTTDTAVLTTSGTSRTLTIAGAGTANIGALTFTSGQTGVGSLTVTSTGATNLNGNNTYAGTTTMNATGGVLSLNGDNSGAGGAVTISAGTVKLGHNNALGSTTLGTSVTSGAVLDLNGRTVGAETLSLSGTGISSTGALVNTNASSASLSGAVTLGANASIGAGNITLSNIGESGGSRSLTKVGSGTLTVSGTSSYSGGTTISDGTLNITGGNNAGGLFTLSGANGPVLKLSNVNALASSATLFGASSAVNTGTVDLAAAGAYTLGSYTGNNMKFTASSGNSTSLTFTNNSTVTSGSSGGRTITNGDANLAILFSGSLDISSSTAGNGVTFAGAGSTTVNGAVFNGSGQLRTLDKSGAGTLTLNGDNSYGGNTTINGTGMVLINGNTSASTGAVNVGSSATLGGLGTVGGAVTLSSSSSIGSTGNTLALASSLTTTGTNTLNASSTVNVAGGTTISAGTFNVNGTLGSALTVNSGATLKGNGAISGAATINGVLAPGASPGILSFDSSLTLGGNTTMEINGTTRGTQYDGINTTGLLTYGGTLTMSFGAPASAGTTFDLFQIGGGSTGSFSNVSIAGSYTLTSLTNSSGIWTGDDTTNLLSFAFDQSTGDLVISAYSAIPEPSTFAAIAGLGVLGLGTTRRRRT